MKQLPAIIALTLFFFCVVNAATSSNPVVDAQMWVVAPMFLCTAIIVWALEKE